MFNYTLKRKSPLAALLCLVSLSSSAHTIKAKSLDNAANLKEAHSIVKDIQYKFGQFFDSKNSEPYKKHIDQLKPILVRIEILAQKYNNPDNERDKLIFTMLKDLRELLVGLYNTLNKKYKNAISLALSLQKALNKYSSPAKKKKLHKMVDDLEPHLETNEFIVLQNIVQTIKSLEKVVPSNKMVCLNNLSKRLRAR